MSRTPVGSVVARTAAIAAGYREALAPGEPALSRNRVTGHSLNFPIHGTCAPTKVCAATCYFAGHPNRMDANLRKQLRLYNATVADPIGTGDRVIREYDREGLTFLRFNGGGDLFAESVKMLNHIGATRPDIAIWCVTRRPEMVALIEPAPNLYVHFSLDRSSLARRAVVEAVAPPLLNLFFSYQAAPGETPDPDGLAGVAVLFLHDYRAGSPLPDYGPVLCPLNGASSIAGACASCRRCFDGTALTDPRR